MGERFPSFEQFWPHYLREHGRSSTRWLHLFGTVLAIGCLALAVVSRQAWWLAVAPTVGYGPAWISHFFVERNRPATFRYPWWSLLGDLKMFWLMLTGGMKRELHSLGLVHE